MSEGSGPILKRFPATIGLMCLYGIFFACMAFAQGGLSRGNSLVSWSSLRSETLIDFGAMDTSLVRSNHQYWRLVTATLLHASLLHLAFNGLALYQIGRLIEDWYGGSVLIGLHVLLGTFANMVSLGLRPDESMVQVGSSGALFGFVGFLTTTAWKTYAVDNGSLFRAFLIIGVSGLATSAWLPADNLAHLGGLLGGVLAGVREERLTLDRLSPSTAVAIGTSAIVVYLACLGLQAWSLKSQSALGPSLMREARMRKGSVQFQRQSRQAASRSNQLAGAEMERLFALVRRSPGVLDSPQQRAALALRVLRYQHGVDSLELSELLAETATLLTEPPGEGESSRSMVEELDALRIRFNSWRLRSSHSDSRGANVPDL